MGRKESNQTKQQYLEELFLRLELEIFYKNRKLTFMYKVS